jgi:hypothetical protein
MTNVMVTITVDMLIAMDVNDLLGMAIGVYPCIGAISAFSGIAFVDNHPIATLFENIVDPT